MPEDVDLELQRIKVVKKENTRSYEIENYCKDSSERYVYLNEDAMTLFRILLDKRKNDSSDSEFLLLNEFSDDGKMHLRALDNRIRMLQKTLKMSEKRDIRSCHDCRRTYASIQYIHGVDIKTIQAQLGHATPQQTWEYIKDVIDAETRLKTLSKGCIISN